MLVLCTWIWSSTTLYDYENLFLVSHQKHSLQPHSIPNFQRFQCYLDILQTCIHHLQIFDHTFTLQQSSEYWMPSIHILQNVHVLLVNLQTVIHLHFHACKMFDTIHTIDAGRTFTNLCILTISDELLNPSEHLCDEKPCRHLPVFIHTQQSSVLSLHPLSSALIPFQISITAVPCHGDSESICACFPSFIPFPFALLLFSSIVFLSLSFVIQSLSFTPAFFLNIFKILYNHPPANDTLKLRN